MRFWHGLMRRLPSPAFRGRGPASWDGIGRDTRYALRRLGRDWRFSAAAVLIFGIAIGVSTTIFSLVNAVLLRPPPFADAARLVNVYQNDRSSQPLIVTSSAAYEAIAASTGVFAQTMAASVPNPSRYLHDGAIRSAAVEYATASYLEVLGLRPSLGRWFDGADERPGAPIVGVLGYQAWTRVFRADPAIVGRVIRVEGVPVTIAGVGPANYRGIVDVGVGTDLWLPIAALPVLSPESRPRATPTIHAPLFVKARLREGVTAAEAQAAMDVLGRRLEAEYPEDFRRAGELALGPGMTVVPSPDVRIHPRADVPFMALASLVLVLVGLVLAIACSNLATLLLVRGAARAREVAVRLAMGATRRQLLRHLLIESLLLSLAGGIAGCIVAWWGLGVLRGIDLPVTVDLAIDYRVLLFAIGLSCATGVAVGLAPALEALKVDLLQMMRDEGVRPLGHRRLTLTNALIVVQVAVSVLLLGGTSVSLQMLKATKTHRAGYAVDGVAMLETDVRFAGDAGTAAKRVPDDLLRRVQALPGVESAALVRGEPMEASSVPIVIDRDADATAAGVEAAVIEAGPGFFDTFRIALLYGRVFDARDRADTPGVAVITDRLARQYFGAENPVGRRFRRQHDPDSWTEVVGVVRDPGTGDFADDVLDPIAPVYFRSYTQSGVPPTTIVARTSGDAAALVAAMLRELRAADGSLPVVTAQTMARKLARSQAAPTAVAAGLGVLGVAGLVLASIGLYAVVGCAVARRSREIGIRKALGARGPQVVWSMVRGVAALMGVGTGIGLFLSMLVILALRASSGSGDIGIGSLSVYRPDIDAVALLVIAAVTATVGVAAAFVPARRAAAMQPLEAMRQ